MNSTIRELSTQELFSSLETNEYTIIDTRTVDAYNGWRMKNEVRGGHIKGAKSLSVKWIKYFDWIEVVRSKGILPDHKIVIYGYNSEDIQKVTKLFLHAKYKEIYVYNHFVDEWSSNPDLPIDSLKRYQQLVYPEWLKSLSSDQNPPNFSENKYVICHAHYRNHDDYLKGHIPGAIALDTLALESPETWNRRSPEELKEALEKHGIDADTTVVLYGRFSYPKNEDPFPGSSAGHLGAIRCAFIMMYAGVKDVKILNGGLQSWEDEGFEITSEETFPQAANDFGAKIPAQPQLAVDVPEAKELIKASDGDIVCVRSCPEYIGELSGYNYIEKKGRIPGSIFGNCGTDAYHMENYRNLDHTTREFHEIEEIWKEVNITPDKHLAFYCGTGWRGSEAFYNAWLMGWPRVSVFDGGWFEWSNDPDNPFETGEPK